MGETEPRGTNRLAFCGRPAKLPAVQAPLAILLYEKIMPGSQLINRLQDLGYRVQTVTDADALLPHAEREKPLVVLADLFSRENKVFSAIARLKQNSATSHVPVIAFSADGDLSLHPVARDAGAALVVTEAAITHHLPQLLEQALTEF